MKVELAGPGLTPRASRAGPRLRRPLVFLRLVPTLEPPAWPLWRMDFSTRMSHRSPRLSEARTGRSIRLPSPQAFSSSGKATAFHLPYGSVPEVTLDSCLTAPSSLLAKPPSRPFWSSRFCPAQATSIPGILHLPPDFSGLLLSSQQPQASF